MTAGGTALAIRDLGMRFGSTEVLRGINMEVEEGEFVVLVGPSGCGKSTLLNIVAGLAAPSGGTIRIGGRDCAGVPPRDRDIAMVFQSYALYPTMTVRQNITFGMECRGVPKAARAEAVDRVAALLQIGHLLDRRPAQLSGGQRQRVAIGRALVRDPVLFLFDEPLSNLDAQLRVEMRMEIKRLHRRVGTTMIYVTHDQIEAMTLATRIAVMLAGEVQQFADPQTVYDEPANVFVARFMGSPPMNIVRARMAIAPDGAVSAVVDRPGDAPVALPLPHRPDVAAPWDGKPVLLGLRPECITDTGRRAAAGPTAATVTAPVEMVEPTGAENMVLLRLGEDSVLAKTDPGMRPAIGSAAEFALDLRKACLFDPATERRIA